MDELEPLFKQAFGEGVLCTTLLDKVRAVLNKEAAAVRKEAYEDGRNIERIFHEKEMRSMANQLRMWQIIANILHEDSCKASS